MSNSQSAPIHPIVLWAQRKDKLFITIEVWDVCDKELSFSSNRFKFFGRKGDTKQAYSLDLELFANVKPTPISETVSGRAIQITLEKEEAENWPRLTKGSERLPYIKTDFNKWVPDEDDEEKFNDFDFGGMGNFDPSQFSMPNYDSNFSDDDEKEGLPEEPLDQIVNDEAEEEETHSSRPVEDNNVLASH